MICHKLSSLNPYICRGKWDAGSRPADSVSSHGLPHSLQYLSLRNSSPLVNHFSPENHLPQPSRKHPIHNRHGCHDPIPAPHSKSIHHLPLDADQPTFYSSPIFDTRLALPAIPVAVKGRSQCATSQCPLYPSKTPKSIGHAINPAPPDGGQHTT